MLKICATCCNLFILINLNLARKHFILIIQMYVNTATEAFKSIQFQDTAKKWENKWWW